MAENGAGEVAAGAVFDPLGPRVSYGGVLWVGLSIKDLIARGVPDAAILAGVKDRLCEQLDAAAELARAGWITSGVGQSMEYDAAEKQAEAALKSPSTATPAKYRMLAATIGIDFDPDTGAPATDVLGVARGVIAARDAWIEAGAAIRETRLRVKAEIRAAGTIAAARAAYEGATWSKP